MSQSEYPYAFTYLYALSFKKKSFFLVILKLWEVVGIFKAGSSFQRFQQPMKVKKKQFY